ncbi:7-cyano-7-deazaguanine synthase QueC [Parvularcula lutaonensis]|uniref:7-cyano-7-deazaguanine synthase n=1 Tax=Parvularcula lutaonensis TaxID=491923 RepID=A0ABV7M8G8_9PROT|nr:7-cyano-7-deazaguanine synthase QueC [Parvularcula lutaonensis]GGY44258.1 7-cyano-7-deazaguanine synthase [Parvularcula lutaonensis]
MMSSNTALVLFSGGQDSATCLAWALKRYGAVETVGFTYGQRHRVELEQRLTVRERMAEAFPDWGAKLGDDHLIDLGFLSSIGETAMTADVEITMQENGLPNTFVPGRNLAFLVAAGALAYRRGAGVLIGGMCETDYSGYPDCRSNTIAAQEKALSLGMEMPLRVETPLMHLSKAESWKLAERIGGETLTTLIEEHSHTCYKGERGTRHPWGYGCGACPACELRAEGHAAWKAGKA